MKPVPKVRNGGIGGAISFLLVWSLNKYADAGIDGEAGAAIGVIVTFFAGYLTPRDPA